MFSAYLVIIPHARAIPKRARAIPWIRRPPQEQGPAVDIPLARRSGADQRRTDGYLPIEEAKAPLLPRRPFAEGVGISLEAAQLGWSLRYRYIHGAMQGSPKKGYLRGNFRRKFTTPASRGYISQVKLHAIPSPNT